MVILNKSRADGNGRRIQLAVKILLSALACRIRVDRNASQFTGNDKAAKA